MVWVVFDKDKVKFTKGDHKIYNSSENLQNVGFVTNADQTCQYILINVLIFR